MLVQNTLLRSLYLKDLDNWEVCAGQTIDLVKKFSQDQIDNSDYLKRYLRKKWLVVRVDEKEYRTLDEIEETVDPVEEKVINLDQGAQEKQEFEQSKLDIDYPIVGAIYTQSTLPKKVLSKQEIKKWRYIRNLKMRLESFRLSSETVIREAILMEVPLDKLHTVQEHINEVMAEVMKRMEAKVKSYDERIGAINAQ